MKLGVDLDGVLVDFDRGWIQKYNEWFGAHVEPSHLTDYASYLFTHFNSKSEFWRWANAVPNFWLDMPPMLGAPGAIYDLTKDGHEVHITTHRKEEQSGTETGLWLVKHMPAYGKYIADVHHVEDKGSVGCDLYIDDNPAVLQELAQQGIPCVKFWHPYNAACEVGIECSSWKRVVEHIRFKDRYRELSPNPTGDQDSLYVPGLM